MGSANIFLSCHKRQLGYGRPGRAGRGRNSPCPRRGGGAARRGPAPRALRLIQPCASAIHNPCSNHDRSVITRSVFPIVSEYNLALYDLQRSWSSEDSQDKVLGASAWAGRAPAGRGDETNRPGTVTRRALDGDHRRGPGPARRRRLRTPSTCACAEGVIPVRTRFRLRLDPCARRHAPPARTRQRPQEGRRRRTDAREGLASTQSLFTTPQQQHRKHPSPLA
jgi:hypothetical protein